MPLPTNPCQFKSGCKTCRQVVAEDRPGMCVSIECDYYTPCSRCGMNVSLPEDKDWCGINSCQFLRIMKEDPNSLEIITASGEKEFIVDEPPRGHKGKEVAARQQEVSTVKSSRVLTRPGTPPLELGHEEKEYYLLRWKDYDGYYRDPVAYVTCHYMILEEIKLSQCMAELLESRGELLQGKEKEKRTIYENLSKLKAQLPEKEAREIGDDENMLSTIYEKFVADKANRSAGKLVRILSPEAVALAPTLPFPPNLEAMLRRLGYSMVDAQQTAAKYWTREDLAGLSSDDLCRFYGFKLRDQYAIPADAGVTDIAEGMDEFNNESVGSESDNGGEDGGAK